MRPRLMRSVSIPLGSYSIMSKSAICLVGVLLFKVTVALNLRAELHKNQGWSYKLSEKENEG
jgi:hypothetical protein